MITRSADSTDVTGPSIGQWRWLGDSSGIAFVERHDGRDQRLALADFREKTIEPLTPLTESVQSFDIPDRQHFAYTVADSTEEKRIKTEHRAVVNTGTGRSLFELLFPDDPVTAKIQPSRRYLWAVVGNKRFRVQQEGLPIVLDGDFVMSRDGRSVITTLPIPKAPSSWETLYPPPYPSYPYRIRPGNPVHQYVRIDLQKGLVQPLVDAPISDDAGWYGGGSPSFSKDGKAILLPGTFVRSPENVPSPPCIAVVDLGSNDTTCVEILTGRTESGFQKDHHVISQVRFVDGDRHRAMVTFYYYQDLLPRTAEYQYLPDRKWHFTEEVKGKVEDEHGGIAVTVKQGLDDPPLLVASNKQTSRVIWNPNPQLEGIVLGKAGVYTWRDRGGQEWSGGLYVPNDYREGRRYPLVIQTHGFMPSDFRPSGLFPTAFAARALAGAGIMVLQVREQSCPSTTPDEAPCAVSRYESAVNQLVAEGKVDRDNIGIIGFSRSCFYVMDMLETGLVHLKAASITDGVMASYVQYLTAMDVDGNSLADEFDSTIGTKPFADGLQLWLKRSPSFNLHKINTPLLVVAEGRLSLLYMWEPYAGLRYQRKPVELQILNTSEHVLTNPAVRMASQGGSVDWFRFWLQNYEDPAPDKADQYTRWRELRKLQEENQKGTPATVQ
jgi:dipeptidyl aminopeptidase/acylaminoacyl peptidase